MTADERAALAREIEATWPFIAPMVAPAHVKDMRAQLTCFAERLARLSTGDGAQEPTPSPLTSDERFIPIGREDMDAIALCGHYMRFRLPCVHEDGTETMSCMQCDRDAAQAQPAGVERTCAWRPIETAPKGSEILGWFPYHAANPPGGSVFVMRWNADSYAKTPAPYFEASGWVWGRRDQRSKQPTHWMPLPAPPSETPAQDD